MDRVIKIDKIDKLRINQGILSFTVNVPFFSLDQRQQQEIISKLVKIKISNKPFYISFSSGDIKEANGHS